MSEAKLLAALRELIDWADGIKAGEGWAHQDPLVERARRAIREHAEGGELPEFIKMMRDALDGSDANELFEAWGGLYEIRFGRLRPGKSEALLSYRDSGDDENVAQYKAWHESGLAKVDAIIRVAELTRRILQTEAANAPDSAQEIDCSTCGHRFREGDYCSYCAVSKRIM